jgi:uncharacterized membrane protein
MTLYLALKWLHVLSGAVLFGTGAGIAFFMFMAWREGDRAAFALTARHVVIADFLFTTTAVIVQPLTGLALAHLGRWPHDSAWLLATYVLYVLIGACWLPVVWIQIQVRRLLAAPGPDVARVDRLMRIWFLLGWPAFIGVLAIYGLMIVKPVSF